jgi:hypothetical protein
MTSVGVERGAAYPHKDVPHAATLGCDRGSRGSEVFFEGDDVLGHVVVALPEHAPEGGA